MSCMGLWRSKHWHGSSSPAWKENRVVVNCLVCQKPIRVSPSEIENTKTCSKKCDAKWRKESGMYNGSNNPAYKGGVATYLHSCGNSYRMLRGNRKKVYEHRYVMEQVLGRKLEPWEEVHHINGDTLDNRPENLFVFDKKHHARKHSQLFLHAQKLERENELLKEKLASISSQVPR